MAEQKFMNWNGQSLVKIGDYMKAMETIKTKETAQEFLRLARDVNEHADSNLGYLVGYFGQDRAQELLDWFGVSHPVFGRTIPGAKEAFEMGKKMGEAAKRLS